MDFSIFLLARAAGGTSLLKSLCMFVCHNFFRWLLDHVGRWNFAWKLFIPLKIEDDIKNEDGFKNEDDLKPNDYLRYEDDLKNDKMKAT